MSETKSYTLDEVREHQTKKVCSTPYYPLSTSRLELFFLALGGLTYMFPRLPGFMDDPPRQSILHFNFRGRTPVSIPQFNFCG